MQNRKLLALVIGVDVLAVTGVLLLLPYRVDDFRLGLSLLASLAAVTGNGPIRIPSIKTSVSVTDAFVFCALAGFGAMPACLVGAAGVLGAMVGKQGQRIPLRVAFNLGNIVLSTACASGVYLLAGGFPGGAITAQIVPLFIATTVYFVLNTGLVTAVIKADSGCDFIQTWKKSGLWTAVPAYAGLTMAVVLLWLLQYIGPSGLALGVPPAWLLTMFYRANRDQQVLAQEKIGQIEETNTVLEDQVFERTQELQQAMGRIEKTNIELLATNEQLLEANRAKNNFLANVSHELRTPLNSVIGFSDLLRDVEYGKLNERQKEFVSDIHDSGEHLLSLINEILDVTKIEAGKMELKLEIIQVRRQVEEAAQMVLPQVSEKSLSLTINCAGDEIWAEVDPRMVRQVLLNLLSNAVKFTSVGGTVEVSILSDQADLVVHVQDSGIGITPDECNRIFEEFYQVDASKKRNFEGTGLGLALVRRMMNLHGGSIEVESEDQVGSLFTCRFNGAIREAQRVAEMDESQTAVDVDVDVDADVEAVCEAKTVLIVDNNHINRKLAFNALRTRGYEIHQACSGEETLGVLHDTRFDLVLLDIQLPDIDGLEVIRRLEADPHTAGMTIVVLSAHDNPEIEQTALAAGCVGFIGKPIRLATFPATVAAFLERRLTRIN
jgi:signal transduction histidine kinase/ActR/RegA family two-component response regulator